MMKKSKKDLNLTINFEKYKFLKDRINMKENSKIEKKEVTRKKPMQKTID